MATQSKRTAARNEKELHDLLRLPGNSQCADCAARNPAWASWNLGIFLCMRCASIHRKLGTHISKVKSLSMDTWTAEQVENMRTMGNDASNKAYNPKNRRPDLPFDSDEVDSAMERFIRKKYQEKSLVDGKPEPPSRSTLPPAPLDSGPQSPKPQTTSKKHKIFGFGFRASKKDKNEPQTSSPYKITPVEYNPTTGRTRELSDRELQVKLAQLQEMGFSDNDQNLDVLSKAAGDMEKTISLLTTLGSKTPSRKISASPAPLQRPSSTSTTTPVAPPDLSNNPYQQSASDSFGLSFDHTPVQSRRQTGPSSPSTNPWQAAMSPRQMAGLEQQFSNMQVAQPLFPHSTGPPQSQYQPNMLGQMVPPPMPTISQQYSYNASPTTAQSPSNPFYQSAISAQSTGGNPFLHHSSQLPGFAPSTNPFLSQSQPQSAHSGSSLHNPAMTDPFGVPLSQATNHTRQYQGQPSIPTINPFGVPQRPTQQMQQATPSVQPQQPMPAMSRQISSQPSNSDYGQPQERFFSQSQLQAFTPQSQSQAPQRDAIFDPQQQSQQSLTPQQTGRYTKTDIMALFNAPPPPQSQPLAAIPEPQEDRDQFESALQPISPTPNNPFGAANATTTKRSVTSPAAISTMYSSGGGGSRNPFLSNNASQQPSMLFMGSSPFSGQSQPQAQGQGHFQGIRHASNDSMSVNNPALMEGRHSPDAFASLSSGYR